MEQPTRLVPYFNTFYQTFLLKGAGGGVIFEVNISPCQGLLLPVQIHGCSVSIERICWVGIGQELGKKGFKDVAQIIQSCPGLHTNNILNRLLLTNITDP